MLVNGNGKFMVWKRHHARRPSLTESRTDAVAINTKMLGTFQPLFDLLGVDLARTVVAVGSEVQGAAVGDRVSGTTNAMSAHRPDGGALGQYKVSAGPVWLTLPVSLSTEAGASLCAGLSTAELGPLVFHFPMCQWKIHMIFLCMAVACYCNGQHLPSNF